MTILGYSWLKMVLLLFLVSAAVQLVCAAAAAGRPNVIMFVIDDLGWNDVGYQGAGYTTPTLDRLTKEGVRSDLVSYVGI